MQGAEELGWDWRVEVPGGANSMEVKEPVQGWDEGRGGGRQEAPCACFCMSDTEALGSSDFAFLHLLRYLSHTHVRARVRARFRVSQMRMRQQGYHAQLGQVHECTHAQEQATPLYVPGTAGVAGAGMEAGADIAAAGAAGAAAAGAGALAATTSGDAERCAAAAGATGPSVFRIPLAARRAFRAGGSSRLGAACTSSGHTRDGVWHTQHMPVVAMAPAAARQ